MTVVEIKRKVPASMYRMEVYDRQGRFLRVATGGTFRDSTSEGPSGSLIDATPDDYMVKVYRSEQLIGAFTI